MIHQVSFEPPLDGPRCLSVRADDCASVLAFDVVVIGSGVAGLSAALAAADGVSVAVVSKGALEESNTRYAQGGIAAVLGGDDSFESHVQDTLVAGAGLCHADVVEDVVRSGPEAIQRFVRLGGQFDRDEREEWALAMEGGHSCGRVVHARGDSTGLEVETVLAARVRAESRVRVFESFFAVDLVTAGGAVAGVIVRAPGPAAEPVLLRCRAVVLATGGAGQIYRETTNPEIATGDGIALAWRAGARLRGMEFVQFHPTTLYVPGVPRLLISETVRGEGGILRDRQGERFMPDVHPLGDLAPRDIVSRGMVRRMIQTADSCVFLDVTHIAPDHFRRRFPSISRVLDRYGVDFAREPIPVHPAAHYTIGGVVADAAGRTSIPGLYAVGEVSCTGLHGANRLGSNSLLEGLVCGSRAGAAAAREPVAPPGAFDEGDAPESAAPDNLNRADFWNSLRSLMWKRVGIEREDKHLKLAAEQMSRWSEPLSRGRFVQPRDLELCNALAVAQIVTAAAIARTESRGTHFRRDFPERDDVNGRYDLVCARRVPPPAARPRFSAE